MDYDVFNGDADGILSLVQWRLAHPKSTQLVTGVKRDIALLDRLELTAGDELVVLDISMAKNQLGLQRALQAGAMYFMPTIISPAIFLPILHCKRILIPMPISVRH